MGVGGLGRNQEVRVQLWTSQPQPRALARRMGWALCGLLPGSRLGPQTLRLRGPSRESQRTDGERTETKALEGSGRVPRQRALSSQSNRAVVPKQPRHAPEPQRASADGN